MFKRLSFFLLILSFFIASCSKKQKKTEHTIAFYNVENLFDTIDNPNKIDESFTPNGFSKWDADRYQKKLKSISKVLGAIDKNKLPILIGLCEVENKEVLQKLIEQKELSKANYDFAHYESKDMRGIDCALLYNKDEFEMIETKPITTIFEEETYTSRDILYVKGKINSEEEIHVLVCHLPSRRGGQEESEHRRIQVAQNLRATVESIQEKEPKAKIVIMGDFNDEPSNKAVKDVLRAENSLGDAKKMSLYNLMAQKEADGEGTYNYRGDWNMLDNIVVSNALLNGDKGYKCSTKEGEIFRESWLCFKKKSGVKIPNRTYLGPKYVGGYSDHFAVYFKIEK